MEVKSTDWKLAVQPATSADCAIGALQGKEGGKKGECLHVSSGVGDYSLGLKDLHLPDMCVPPILVIREDADLKHKGLHRSRCDVFIVLEDIICSHLRSIFICDIYIHPFLWLFKIQYCDLLFL